MRSQQLIWRYEAWRNLLHSPSLSWCNSLRKFTTVVLQRQSEYVGIVEASDDTVQFPALGCAHTSRRCRKQSRVTGWHRRTATVFPKLWHTLAAIKFHGFSCRNAAVTRQNVESVQLLSASLSFKYVDCVGYFILLLNKRVSDILNVFWKILFQCQNR